MKAINILLLLCIGYILLSCSEDKYLNIYPLTEITEGNFYENQTQIEQALNDVYRQFGLIYDAHGLPDLFGEQSSDNTYILSKAGGDNFTEQINEYRILTNNGRIRTAWDRCYSSIFICNNVIEKIENSSVEIDDAKKRAMISEALVVRSLIYFNMVRAWGDIPLVLKRTSPSESYDYIRVPSEKIYEQIISDLQFAKNNLPESYTGNEIGKITKYGAASILAKIYLTLNDKGNAENELRVIIDSNKFSLDSNNDGQINIDDYKYIFHPNTKNCKESILEVQYRSGANTFNSNHQNVYSPFSHAFNLVDLNVPSSIFRGEGINTPTGDLMNEFEVNDLRKNASIYPGFTNQATNDFVEYPFTIKFFDPVWTNPGNNFAVIRYADILLMYSEVTNDPTFLNYVRERAGLALYGTEGYPSDMYPTLELAIEHERRVEFSFEFHRFFDLKRTGRAIAVLKGKGFDIDENKLLFPIPQNAIDVNPKLTQNPGY